MLNHSPINKWQKGLLKLFGVIDGYYWNILWAIAATCDDRGVTIARNHEFQNACVREEIKFMLDMRRMRNLGLIKTIAKRKFEKGDFGMPFREVRPRILAIYSGIEFGMIPDGAQQLKGIVPRQYLRYGKSKNTTHRLLRDKFKPNPMVVEYPNFGNPSRYEYRKITPSPKYQRKKIKEKALHSYRKRYSRKVNEALNRKFL